ncbi:4'-phosphopantetheinyl transferase family protein [Streptococcus agalactiae]|uniref:4'-phosphopantetheinyl transferase family protein n=1 Tax=Streptococcus agalactiae TaxID=1311 RepID=UPI000E07F09A|nr:4'-phosphopantetheinyl transferase superfamily protein [Streptococcus agalactiae]SUN23631.1 4'-phosphopantetheinyl transferase [Streptococcus agalactiae]
MRNKKFKLYSYSSDIEFMKAVTIEVLSGVTVVIKADTNDKGIVNPLLSYIKSEEIMEANKYYFSKDRTNYIVSRGIVNCFYKTLENKKINDIEWKRSDNNKPKIDNSYGITFNISHTGGCVFVGFSKGEIGVDVEKINHKFKYGELLNNVFTDREIKFIGEDAAEFYTFWVVKEAYLKAIGYGLIRNPKEVEITNISDELIKIRDEKNASPIIFRKVNIENKYVGAVCIMEEK